MSTTLPKLYQTLTDKKLQLRKRRAAMKAHEAKLRALFTDIEALDGEPHSDGDWIFVPVTGDKHKFIAFARVVAKHGFRVPKVEKGATGFTQLESIGEGDSQLYLYFQFSSSACRRVKVGTKTVEQDVYETVCDEVYPHGETAPASPPQSVSTADSIPF